MTDYIETNAWPISPAMSNFLDDHRAFAIIKDKKAHRWHYCNSATHFVLVSPMRNALEIQAWLQEQGIPEPWHQRLKCAKGGPPCTDASQHTIYRRFVIGVEMTHYYLYAFFADQAALAIVFKLRFGDL